MEITEDRRKKCSRGEATETFKLSEHIDCHIASTLQTCNGLTKQEEIEDSSLLTHHFHHHHR